MLLVEFVEIIDAKISNRTKDLDVCADIVSDVLYHIDTLQGAAADIELLFTHKDLLRTVIQAVINTDRSTKLVVTY